MSKRTIVITVLLVAAGAVFAPAYAQELAANKTEVAKWSIITAGFALAFAAGLGALGQGRAGIASVQRNVEREIGAVATRVRRSAGIVQVVLLRLPLESELLAAACSGVLVVVAAAGGSAHAVEAGAPARAVGAGTAAHAARAVGATRARSVERCRRAQGRPGFVDILQPMAK